jgi:hypothetical protein
MIVELGKVNSLTQGVAPMSGLDEHLFRDPI